MTIKSRIELAEYFAEQGFRRGAEIGVAQGRYSELLCKKIPNLKLYCIDSWTVGKDARSKEIGAEVAMKRYAEAWGKLHPLGCILIRKLSLDAVKEFEDESLDFVYIDACHEYDYVMQDIIEWTKKVRRGGIVAGHDYYDFTRSGVVEAVNDYTRYHKKKLNIIPKVEGSHSDNRHPNWWFVR